MTQYLVASPKLPDDDLVAQWRAWKSANGPAPFTRIVNPDGVTVFYRVTERDLTWMCLEIERLRAAIEGLVKTDGGRQ